MNNKTKPLYAVGSADNAAEYIAPALTVVTFKIEKGFAASTGYHSTQFLDMFFVAHNDYYNDQAQENWHEGGDLFSWEGE